MEQPTPRPGSDAAIAAGCTCPILDNAHGAGWLGNADLYWISADCPLHGADAGASALATYNQTVKGGQA